MTEETREQQERRQRPEAHACGYVYRDEEYWTPQPPRGRAGSKTDNPCTRPATHKAPITGCPLCEHHLRVCELGHEESYWALGVEILADWLEVAEGWDHEDLIRFARANLQEAQTQLGDVEARMEEAKRAAKALA